MTAYESNQPFLAEAILDEDGNPWCDPPDDCQTCLLYLPLTPERRAAIRKMVEADPDPCQDGDCRAPAYARGMCYRCYKRWWDRARRRRRTA